MNIILKNILEEVLFRIRKKIINFYNLNERSILEFEVWPSLSGIYDKNWSVKFYFIKIYIDI
jgi:hypothetical protein